MIQTTQGQRAYRVSAVEVIDARTAGAPARDDIDGLVLVTCYPFDAVVPGGPLRYVVSATAEQDALAQR